MAFDGVAFLKAQIAAVKQVFDFKKRAEAEEAEKLEYWRRLRGRFKPGSVEARCLQGFIESAERNLQWEREAQERRRREMENLTILLKSLEAEKLHTLDDVLRGLSEGD